MCVCVCEGGGGERGEGEGERAINQKVPMSISWPCHPTSLGGNCPCTTCKPLWLRVTVI